MRNRILTLIFLLSTLGAFSQAKKVTIEEGKALALEFSNKKLNKNLTSSSALNVSVWKKNTTDLMYVYNWENSFVVVSAHTSFPPIIAYSDENNFVVDELPDVVKYWMGNYEAGMIKLMNSDKSNEIDPGWEKLANELSNMSATDKATIAGIAPLLNSRWNQDKWYNDYCPEHPNGPNGRCYAGCVATSMGQVMYYYQHPTKGVDYTEYTHPQYGILSVDFDAEEEYDYSKMGIAANLNTRDEISRLLYHAGVSVHMNYSPAGSGSHTDLVVYALTDHFDYAPSVTMIDRSSFSNSHWRRELIDNLYMHKPIIYAGADASYGGHAWNCDGVNDSLYFHMNWGWGGAGNGYFLLDDLSSGNGDFNEYQRAVINISPVGLDYCYEPKEYFETEMTFNDGSGNSLYKNNTDCKYYIRSDSAKVILKFNYFRTEEDNDVLRVYDGDDVTAPLIGEYSGDETPEDIISSSSNLLLHFITNESIQKQGWEVEFKGVGDAYGIEEASNGFEFYPNPVNEVINLKSPSQGIYNIYDMTGQLIMSGELVANQATRIDVDALSKGIYVVKVTNELGISSSRFVKQ